jgi:hypothetical protein
MSSGDRFYQLELRHRPALHGDVGSLLKIEGLVLGGEGAQAIFMLPDVPLWGNSTLDRSFPPVIALTVEQWTDWLQRSDNPEILISGSLDKAFHRKVRYEISGFVQQKVWLADDFKCVYCAVKIGKAPLTIDHFIPLEMGGANDTSNYLTACKKCNKDKGAMDPQAWCALRRIDYNHVKLYLASRIIA